MIGEDAPVYVAIEREFLKDLLAVSTMLMVADTQHAGLYEYLVMFAPPDPSLEIVVENALKEFGW